MTISENWIDYMGWAGTVLYLIPYFLLITGYWSSKSTGYHMANVVASILSVANAWHYGSIPVAVTCGVWGLIAIYGMWKDRAYTSNR